MKRKIFPILGSVLVLSAFFASKANAVADYYSSGFPAATVANLKWTIDTVSVSTTYMNTYIDPGSKKWNGISSKVNVVKGTATDYNIRFLVASSADPDLVGLTVPYCASGNGDICNTGVNTYTAARIYMYESNMAAKGFSTDRRIACAAHELGHALSMKHTSSGVATVASLMAGVLPATSTVENLDKSNLRGKWGN